MKKYLLIQLVLLLTLTVLAGLLSSGVLAATAPRVLYRTHVQNDGWQDFVSDGALSGTAGRSLRLEGIEIKLEAADYDLGVRYQTHIQNIGWEADTDRGFKNDGAMSGTEGLSYRLEAIQISLTGAAADTFDVYYQVHAQNFGWLGWAKNGESAGTAGYSYRLEGIHIVILPKGSSPPTGTVDQLTPFVERQSVPGNLLIQTTASDFNSNALGLDRVAIVPDAGDGAIVLNNGNQAGVYTSNVFNTSPFTKAVLSWNADTPAGSLVQVEARVCENAVDANGQSTENWSDWLSWGRWGSSINRASGIGTTDSPLAKLDVDTLVVKNGKTANKIQYRVILHSGSPGITPNLRLVALALRNQNPGQEITKVFYDTPNLFNLPVLNVPQLSQMVRDPAIADSICSPTSVTMMLAYYGTVVQPETAAWGAYDYGYQDFGNWPFNTAYAASLGYQAYVDYSTIEGLKREIAGGHPVAVAVAYKNSAAVSGDLPVVDGAPIRQTPGHLIVVCGFTQENGTDYIIINDPAAASNAGVRVKYRLDQFAAAWAESGNIAYIIH
ncbi:C39 family peptidase [Acetobacterium wieringae]|uniref:C39 family peptidase n=1 Tax=Acetobacterium wieringae TaxID=52694 RepID=UPI002B215F69|nr:C39 family peptidase [Acetobacterium wieringae]MEA4806288.1 C39 family peptidase [Acetobacterium wieringae]